MLLIRPKQNSCGCRFCEGCVIDLKECPTCKDGEVTLYNDKSIEKEIMYAKVKCVDCLDPISFKDLSQHFTTYIFSFVECSKCYLMFHHEKTDEHFNQVCLKTNVACMSCNKFMTRGELNEHKNY